MLCIYKTLTTTELDYLKNGEAENIKVILKELSQKINNVTINVIYIYF